MELRYIHQHEKEQRRVCLLFHGLSGTTTQLTALAQELHAKGYHVIVPMLAGDKDINELAGVHWSQWTSEISNVVVKAQYLSSKSPILIGLSLGGFLALHATAMSSRKVKGVVVMSSPFRFRSSLTFLVLTLLGYLPHGLLKKLGTVPKRRAIGEPALGESHSIPALVQLVLLRKQVLKLLPKISAPSLFIQDPYDYHLSSAASAIAVKNVNSDVIKQIFLPRAAHKMTQGPRSKEVWQAISSFIDQLEDQED